MSGSNKGNFVNLYSTKASVFQIDPETKKSWLSKCKSPIPISFIASLPDTGTANEPSKRELKIVGIGENGETIMDAHISPKTVFARRTPTFGQLIDSTGTLYGLGFMAESDISKFSDALQQLQRDILSASSSNNNEEQFQQNNSMSNNSNAQSHNASSQSAELFQSTTNQQNINSNPSETNGRLQGNKGVSAQLQQYSNTLAHNQQHTISKRVHQTTNSSGHNIDQSSTNGHNEEPAWNSRPSTSYSRSHSMFGLQNRPSPSQNNGKTTPETENSLLSQPDYQTVEQLKYENERLKMTLEESTIKLNKCHNEILNLRTNNYKLTQAMQESRAHVEEWDRELISLREENKELKRLGEENKELQLKIMTLESGGDPEKAIDYKNNLQQKIHVDELHGEIKKKDRQIEDLRTCLEELELKVQNGNIENHNTVIDSAISSHQKQKFDVLNAKLEAKLGELSAVQKEFSQLVNKLYH